jgi:hypothetical protein
MMDEREELQALRRLAELEAKAGKTEARQTAQQAPGWLQGLASVAQGPTFGFADEIGGLVGGAKAALTGGEFGKGYTGTRDVMREMAALQSAENPWTTGITRAMASAPTMLLGGGGQATTMLGQAGQAAKVGGISGAVSGAGQSTADSALGVLGDIAAGGALGAASGGAAVPLMRAGGAVASNVGARFSESAAAKYAREKVAEALARDARGAAVQKNFDAPFTQATTRLGKLGDEARLVDAGGQNTRQLLDTLAMLPGRTKEAAETAIRSRQAGRADRLIGAADDALQVGGKRAAATVEQLIQDRSAAAAPLYKQVHAMTVPVDDELSSILSAANQLGATKLGAKMAVAERQPFTLAEGAQTASMRDLDRLKQALDTKIMNEGTNTLTGRVTPEGASYSNLRSALVGYLDKATGGAYADARQAFAGPSAVIDAVNAGRKAMTKDDASLSALTAGMTQSEMEGFRVGAFEALRAKLGKESGQTEILKMWKEPATQEKLRALFGSERAFREFASTAAREGRLKGLESVGRGSQTAARQYAAGDLDVPAMVDAAQAMSGSPMGILAGATRAWNNVKTPEPARDAMGQLLLSQGAAGRQGILSLEETLRQINQNRMLQASGLGLLGGLSSGSVVGGLLAP